MQIELNQEYKREQLIQQLCELGYQRMSVVESQGEFAIRGEIVDIFPIQLNQPVRLLFFAELVEQIKYFDPEKQTSLADKPLSAITILPAKEIVLSPKLKADALDCLRQKRSELSAANYEEALDSLNQESVFLSSSKYRCYYAPKLYSWLYLLAGSFKVFLWQKSKLDLAVQNYLKEISDEFQSHTEQEAMPPKPNELYLDFTEFEDLLDSLNPVEIYESYIENASETYFFSTIENVFLPQLNKNIFATRLQKVQELLAAGVKLILSSPSYERAKRLSAILEEFDLPSQISEELDFTMLSNLAKNKSLKNNSSKQQNYLTILPYPLRKSFCFSKSQKFPEDLLCCLLYEDDLFGRNRSAVKERKLSELKTKISDLKLGDLVAHIDYGRGRYCGIETVEVGDEKEDFLLLEYQNKDKLYVRVDQINYKIQKYTSGAETEPTLDKLGSSKWQVTRKKVEVGVQQKAEELIKIYAEKQAAKSYSFSIPAKELLQFEESFPFVETDDQLRAIEEVYQDLKREQPMDRLICGDAGFGKTEVAMRATFQVVMSGYQVLLLAPTTILVQQHLKNFSSRFKDFPVKIASLSRFLSPKLAKNNIEEFKKGTIDILIGTHMALKKELCGEKLGLLIIDEEHRFGVVQKENLRKVRAEINLMCLSATPIPRL